MKHNIRYTLIVVVMSLLSTTSKLWAQYFEPTTPSAGCRLLQLEGFLDSRAEAALEYVNILRLEACLEGVPDPRNSDRRLTIDDYYPLQWSTDLEYIARRRALEASVTYGHATLNNSSIWYRYNGTGSNAEDLAWGRDMFTQIIAYYAEKSSWVNKVSGAVTGHYTSMINPGYRYIGMADFNGTATIQLTGSTSAGRSSEMLSDTGWQLFSVDVKTDYIQGHELYAMIDNVRKQGSIEIYDDQIIPVRCAAKVVYNSRTSYMIEPSGVTYTSSAPNVASIDAAGKLMTHAPGQTIITGRYANEAAQTLEVTVKCRHQYRFGPLNDTELSGVCTKCGDMITHHVPSTMTIQWRNNEGSSFYYTECPTYNPIGSSVVCYLSGVDGDSDYKDILIDCSDPTLLEVPSELSVGANYFKVLGGGTVTLRVYSKYNPILSETFTIQLSACRHEYELGEPGETTVESQCKLCGEKETLQLPTSMTFYWRNSDTATDNYYYGSPATNNPVGSTLVCWFYSINGDSKLQEVIVECSDRSLLDCPESFEKTGSYRFTVLGTGKVTVKFYPKYRPSLSRTYTIKLGETD